jgi:hypothetical protein
MDKKERNKKGQVAIFVIVAIVIVGVILVIFMYPRIRTLISPGAFSPQQYLEDCIKPEVQGAVTIIAKQGGDENPVGYIMYKGTKVKYLCYTTGYYKTCLIQQPMIITHFGDELGRMLTPKVAKCAQNLKAEYERMGYTVEIGKINSSVLVAPGKIIIEFLTPMGITREEESRRFDKFDVSVDSEIYNLLAITTSVVDYEATYGDSETTLYMDYYPDLKIEKIKLEDGVKIYRMSNVVTNETFQFATRSLVWPAGYGL